MSFYANPNKWTTREEKLKAKIKKNMVMPGTNEIDLDKAKNGWAQFYSNGVVTFNVDLFFIKERQRIRQIKTLRQIYFSWRYGYI